MESLSSSVRKKLRKIKKETVRVLLPDAPPRKRSRNQSPDRSGCRFVPGTPTIPPAPILQAWEIRQQKKAEMSPMSNRSFSTASDVPSPQCDFTTGGLKTDMSPSIFLVAKTEHGGAVDVAVKKAKEGVKIQYKEAADVDIEKWLEDLGDDVVDKDDLAIDFDVGWSGHDYVTDAPATLPETLNLELTEWLTTDDLKSDRVLTDLLPIGHLTFDWTADHNTFTGQREQFKGTPGPTFPVDVNTRPVDIFLKYFDDDLLELIVRQTNRHATYQIDRFRTTENSRLNKWTNTDKCEITTFLAILIFQGLAPLSVESHYWKETGYLTLKYFKTLMTYNRFLLLKRLLNFSDSNISVSTDQTQRTDPKLRKIWPVLSHLQKKFSELYLPGQEIAIDESLLKWQGRLSFAQKIATKAAKVGVKTYELCESSTGYLWNFYVYTGKDSQQPSSELQDMDTAENSTKPPAPTCATARIVLNLVNPLLNLGHTLVMDNFYNSPLLARYLKSHGTDCYGTLRINREFVPESIKSVSKNDMRVGEVIHTFSRDVSICLWRDNNLVSMLSTYHENSIGGKEKYGRYKYKPQIVLDYNLMMGGVDKKDQLLSAHPIERSRNIIWYKKVFRHLLNITIVNSYVVYKIKHPNTTQRAFREKLAEELVGAFRPLVEVEPQPMVVTNIRSTLVSSSLKAIRPRLKGNHFVGKGATKSKSCVWCKKSRSKYICKQCNVTLCLDICFEEYHTV